jgi:hypothetical protein
MCQQFAIFRNIQFQSGLPDGFFLNQISLFWQILEGLRGENVVIF